MVANVVDKKLKLTSLRIWD